MKYLVLILVVVAVLAVIGTARRRRRSVAAPPRQAIGATPIVACAHCQVHLPQADALLDAQGRPYCSEPHRLAGPRDAT